MMATRVDGWAQMGVVGGFVLPVWTLYIILTKL
jgi:hypothetical protein